MSWPELVQRLGCCFGRHLWSPWQGYRSAAANGWALWVQRRCVLCGKYQDDMLTRIEADHVHHHDHPPLHYDPG
jgi:hypothetical protein